MAAICCSSSVLFIPIFTFGIYLYKTTPTRHVRYHSVQSLPAWFFISPPPVWAGICRTARQGCLIPYSSLSCCNIPRTPLRLPCSPAEVSLSPGFQGRMPPLPHAGDAAPIFPSSITIPRLTCTKALPPAFHRQISLREALPSSPIKVFRMFCVHTY